jgi:hypothetical protein
MAVVLDEAMLVKLQAAQVDINVHVTATINVTPFVAKQKVNVLLLDKIGTGLLSESPDLAASEGRLYWRVPVALALPGRGRLGHLGAIDVDVQTGEVLADDTLISDITRHANQLAASSAS